MADGIVSHAVAPQDTSEPETPVSARIAYLGHDACDAAVRRRLRAFLDDGLTVAAFMPRRRALKDVFWSHTDLGQTHDGAFLQRIGSVLKAARRLSNAPDFLAANLIVARNLDMLACAFAAKRLAGLDTPVVYECLDIHRLLCRTDLVGRLLRGLEGNLLSRCAALWVSSPTFLQAHFHKHYRFETPTVVIENRLPQSSDYGARPSQSRTKIETPLRLGWVGNLRCQRSFDLLLGVADRFGDAIQVHLHGQPARTEIAVFEPEIKRRANVVFHGPYNGPPALAGVYSSLDIVWAGDFMEAGANSLWLLPNRIYEGGYFGVPAIAPVGTATANWILEKQVGLAVREPLGTELGDLVEALLETPESILKAGSALADLPDSVFVEPRGTLAHMVSDILRRRGERPW